MNTVPNGVYDGSESFAGGADGGRRPNLIDPTQYEEGDNVICRGGDVSTRPPILDIDLSFENPDLWYFADGTFGGASGGNGQSSYAFANGQFQEASYYSRARGKEYIMASINGRLYRIAPGTGQTASVFDIALDRRNRRTIRIAYHLQADRYHITQDGEANPIIFDGTSARRAGTDEIFPGTVMGTGMGRIVLVATNGFIYFGDLFDSTGNAGADMLRFTETKFLNEGFPSALPASMGKPTAIIFVPQQDTATGVGECLVFGENGCESFFLSIPREAWKDNAFQRTALLEVGNVGHRNPTIVNQDIWFKDPETDWRSYRQARATQNLWSQIPLSTNVDKWIRSETPNLLQYGSAMVFNNRLLMTTTPYWNNGKVYHNGGLSLDFDVLSSFGGTGAPSWDGHFTERTMNPALGLRCLQLVKGTFNGKKRAFMFALNSLNRIVLKEVMPEPTGNDSGGAITARLRPRSYSFSGQSSSFNEKRLFGADLWIDNVEVSTTFDAFYRPDQIPQFLPLGERKTVAPIDVPATDSSAPVRFDGYSPRESIESPDETADTLGTNRLFSRGYELQPEFVFTGRASIRRLRLTAIDEKERANVQE